MSESQESKISQHDKDIAVFGERLSHLDKSFTEFAKSMRSDFKIFDDRMVTMLSMTKDIASVQDDIVEIQRELSSVIIQNNETTREIKNIKEQMIPIKETVKAVDSVGWLIRHSKTMLFIFTSAASLFGVYIVSLLKGLQ